MITHAAIDVIAGKYIVINDPLHGINNQQHETIIHMHNIVYQNLLWLFLNAGTAKSWLSA